MNANIPTPSHWHILGLGAIGGLFACRMQAAGIPVAACPSRSLPASNMLPLVLEEKGERTRFDIPVSHDTPIERLLLTTKAQQSLAALQQVRARLAHNAVIVVLQNGLGVHDEVCERWPELQIVAGSTTEGANRPTPDHIRHAGNGTTWLGPWRARDEAAAQQVFAEWQALPMQRVYDATIAARLWEKLVMNCAVNPLTALLDCRNGELVAHAETRQVMHAVVSEVCTLMRACGQVAETELLYQKVLAVAERTGTNISSMLQDQRSGRLTEIDYINGYVARQSVTRGLAAPINQWLLDAVQARKRLTPTTLLAALPARQR